MKRELSNGVLIEFVQGNIAAQKDLDAVVNAANAQLRPGSGVAGAIHSAAGSGLYEECRALAPISPGQAVITGGHGLPNRFVVHCLGPVYGKHTPSDELLAACFRNALRVADEAGAKSIGFPAISTGVFGYPLEEAAQVAVTAVLQAAPGLSCVRLVRFVLFGKSDKDAFERAMDEAG